MFVPLTSGTPQMVAGHTFAVESGTSRSSPDYIIDPTTEPDQMAPGFANGSYYVIQGPTISATGQIVDYSNPSGVDSGVTLDGTLKANGMAVLQPSGSASSFQINDSWIPGSIYTINVITNPSDLSIDPSDPNHTFTVTDTFLNQTIPTEYQLAEAAIRSGSDGTSFSVQANPNIAKAGQTITISITLKDASGNVMGTTFVTYTCANGSYTIPFEEASGSRYRKIALNGRPLPDEKPHETTESDQEKEETYIDALTLGLHHSVTDVYVPVPGSDLALSARRDTLSEVWNMHSGLRPHERFDRPFGAGWTSNLCVDMETVTTSDGGPTYTYVTDQNGASHRFLQVHDAQGALRFVPMPSDQRENTDYTCTLDGTNFIDRYNTKIVFSGTSFSQTISADRYKEYGTEVHTYKAATQITDRYNNTLTYTYPANARTLIPSKIAASGSEAINIEQNDSGQITQIWDPNGNEYQYGYITESCTYNGVVYQEPVLNIVTPPGEIGTTYTYDSSMEADLTPTSPVDMTDGQATDKYHIDLDSIKDPMGNLYTITYKFDQTKWDYNTADGYFKETGAPRNVANVILPGTTGTAVFTNNSSVQLEYLTTIGSPTLTATSLRQNIVTDAAGGTRTYTFGIGGTNSSVVFNVGGLDPNTPTFAVPKIVFYNNMKVDYSGAGSELFTFDPTAGLALKSVLDLSGNTTSYTYTDSIPAVSATGSPTYATIFLYPNFFGYFQDPNTQSDALGYLRSFHYGIYRIMDSETDEAGRSTQYALDQYGRRSKEDIYDENNTLMQETVFTYQGASNAVTSRTVRNLNGPSWATDIVTSYTLDSFGRTLTESDAAGSTNYTYDLNGNKLTVMDPKMHTTAFDYDARNRVTGIHYADGSSKLIHYWPNGNKEDERDENQHWTHYEYDPLNNLSRQTRYVSGGDIVVTSSYNGVSSKTAEIGPGTAAKFMQYDTLQRLFQTTDALNNNTFYYYDGINPGGDAFDSSSFKPTKIIDIHGYTTNISYNALYSGTLRVVGYAPGLSATTATVYDKVQNATSVTDARGHTTIFEYDGLNRPTKTTYADGHFIQNWYTSTGLKWQVRDEGGNLTQTIYDGASRPTATVGPAVMNEYGLLVSSNTQSRLVYDAAGNIYQKYDARNNRWQYQYDARNRVTEEDRPDQTSIYTGYYPNGNVYWTVDGRGYTTTTLYDEANRPKEIDSPPVPIYGAPANRPTTSKTYDPAGNVLQIEDPNTNTTTNTYDPLNRITSSATLSGSGSILVSDSYNDPLNTMTVTVNDGDGEATTFQYDGMARNTQITDKQGHSITFTYDGLVKTSREDQDQQVTNYGYDNRNRLSAINYVGRSQDNRTYGYDGTGNLNSVVETGSNALASVSGSYDAMNRMTSETSGGVTHAYTYDVGGNRRFVTYGGTGRVVQLTYDAMNRLQTLLEGARTTTYSYDGDGNLQQKVLPNGDAVTNTYDGLSRLQCSIATSANGSLLYQYLNGYDAGGNCRWEDEYYLKMPVWRDNVLSYDPSNRLLQETTANLSGTTSRSYEYDNAGNRTKLTDSSGVTQYTYNDLNQLTELIGPEGTVNFSYDFNGNRMSRTTSQRSDSYSYDYENRLTQITQGGNTSSYAYDYRTRRIGRTENNVFTQVIFSGGESVQEITGGTLAAEFIRGSDWGGGVGGILYSLRGGAPSFDHYDRRGDVTLQTDGSGSISYQAGYEAFGQHKQQYGVMLEQAASEHEGGRPDRVARRGDAVSGFGHRNVHYSGPGRLCGRAEPLHLRQSESLDQVRPGGAVWNRSLRRVLWYARWTDALSSGGRL